MKATRQKKPPQLELRGQTQTTKKDRTNMSIARKNTPKHDLQEAFEYHDEEAGYYLEQYLRHLEEVERMYNKFKEHASYRDEFSMRIKEDAHVS